MKKHQVMAPSKNPAKKIAKWTGAGFPESEAKTVVPSPVQKTMFMGLPSDRNAPVEKSPRVELDVLVSSSLPWRASLSAFQASLSMRMMPIKLKIILAMLFWMRKASPVNAMIAQVVSPTSEPNCTNNAGTNPRAAPRRTVSAVMTPGGAQKAMARIKDEIKSDMISLEYRPRETSVCIFLRVV